MNQMCYKSYLQYLVKLKIYLEKWFELFFCNCDQGTQLVRIVARTKEQVERLVTFVNSGRKNNAIGYVAQSFPASSQPK